jgi:rubrerythrin
VSRIPRYQEHLKTGFTGEAVSAARYRAFAARAARDGRPNLADQWRRLAVEKDALAVKLLEAAEQVRGEDADLGEALSEERYENDVLYPKMIRDVDEATADVLLQVLNAQKEHQRQLETLRQSLNASEGDVSLPAAVDQGGEAKKK